MYGGPEIKQSARSNLLPRERKLPDDLRNAIRRFICDRHYGNSPIVCDCWGGENCALFTPLSDATKTEREVTALLLKE